MPRIVEANGVDEGGRYAIVAAKFNDFIVDRLLAAAVGTLKGHGVEDENITIVKVPGCFELGVVCRKLAKGSEFDAVIALGCVIRGGTPHFEYVAGEAANAVAGASAESGVPVIFGVLTTENLEQAIDRAGAKMGNKGADAAVTAIEMVNLMRALDAL